MDADRRREADAAFAFLDNLLGSLPVPDEHRALLGRHVDEVRAQAEALGVLPAVHLPLLAHAAVAGTWAGAVPAAGAAALVYLGADLMDNLADHELPARWTGTDPALVSLAAATLLSALPPLALARLDVPPARRAALADRLARCLLTMSAGQHDDLAFPDRDDVSPAACRAVAERKSGAEIAFFAALGAAVATDAAERVAAFEAYGLALGAAGQIASDLGDLWGDGPSQDLLTGKRTLPVAFALAARPANRAHLLGLLADARVDVGAHDAVRGALAEAGALRHAALVVEMYHQRARRALGAARAEGPACAALLDLLAETSLLPSAVPAHS